MPTRAQSAEERQKAVDEALQKLQQLAKRQQELDAQQKQGQQLTSEQRWQQKDSYAATPRSSSRSCRRPSASRSS